MFSLSVIGFAIIMTEVKLGVVYKTGRMMRPVLLYLAISAFQYDEGNKTGNDDCDNHAYDNYPRAT